MNKKLVWVLLLLSLSACAAAPPKSSDPVASTKPHQPESPDHVASKWLNTDTKEAIAFIMEEIKNSTKLQGYLERRNERPKLLVGEMQNNTCEADFPLEDMNEKLLTALFNQGDFMLIDKKARKAILAEITYQNDGTVDPAQAKKIGKEHGADIAIFGAVRMLPNVLENGKTIKEYSVNLRITELETGLSVFSMGYDKQKFSEHPVPLLWGCAAPEDTKPATTTPQEGRAPDTVSPPQVLSSQIVLGKDIKAYRLSDAQELTGNNPGKIMGNEYRYGFYTKTRYPEARVSGGSAYFNIGGKYTSMSGICGPMDNAANDAAATLTIYGDERVLAIFELQAGGMAKLFNLNVAGITQVKFEYSWGNDGRRPNSQYYFGVANVVVTNFN